MEPSINRPEPESEFFTDEQCWILETWNDSGDPALSLARARVEPGVTTKLHKLAGVTERYQIIEGTGAAEIGDLPPQEVGPGDVVFIPPEVPQRITNTGDKDLLFYCICTPPFTEACYESLE